MKQYFTPARKKVIFFDMNNTLFDQERTFEEGFVRALQELTGRWTDDGEPPDARKILAKYKTEWARRSKSNRKKPRPGELQRICLRSVLRSYPFPANDSFVQSFFRKVSEGRNDQAVLFPFVRETLELLSGKYKLGIISNGDRGSSLARLEKSGLTAFFKEKHIFTSQAGGIRKPHAGIYERALQAFAIKPHQAVMVGNSWRNDIFGATRCGMDAVWINPGYGKAATLRKIGKERVIILKNFKQLQQIL